MKIWGKRCIRYRLEKRSGSMRRELHMARSRQTIRRIMKKILCWYLWTGSCRSYSRSWNQTVRSSLRRRRGRSAIRPTEEVLILCWWRRFMMLRDIMPWGKYGFISPSVRGIIVRWTAISMWIRISWTG